MRSGSEKVILVGCILSDQSARQVESSMQELSLLVQTAQGEAVATITQKRETVDPSFYVGKGKLLEIEEKVHDLEADSVIFNTELSPSQVQNIERHVSCKVIDRTQLILDIFAMRAHSKEGKLQVEWAQLQYLLPRIVGQGTSLSRLGGGIGTRGPGETQLEVERRHIRRRMSDIRKQLDKIVAHRERYRERRSKNDVFQVALVGYTNAGKSTLLKQLTQTEQFTENRLFATLDPTTRKVQLSSGFEVVISDTVGFIQDLPTTLIAAFRSTLEEVKEADLILHVIDSTDPQYVQHLEVVSTLLADLDASSIPMVKIFNKKDQSPAEGLLVTSDDLYVSAFNSDDLIRIKKKIENMCKEKMSFERLHIPVTEGKLISKLQTQGIVQEMEWVEEWNRYDVEVYLPAHHRLEEQIKPFKKLKQ